MNDVTFQIDDDADLPDHPWDEANRVDLWCGICGQQQITHDGNLDRVFDALERLSRKADEVWWMMS